jgi:hypothetical protein
VKNGDCGQGDKNMEEITWQTPEPWASEVQPGKSLPSDVSDEVRKLSVYKKGKFSKGLY